MSFSKVIWPEEVVSTQRKRLPLLAFPVLARRHAAYRVVDNCKTERGAGCTSCPGSPGGHEQAEGRAVLIVVGKTFMEVP